MKNYLLKAAYFTNQKAMDESATNHRKANWNQMNDTDRLLLDIIRQHSIKYGAAHLKHQTMAAIIGKSNSTVKRSIDKLIQLKIIKKTTFIRPLKKGNGANIYTIQAFEGELVTNKNPTMESELKKKVVFEKEEKQEEIVNESIDPQTFYEQIQEFLYSTIGDSTAARNIYSVFQKVITPQLKFTIHAHREKEFEQLAFRALHITVQSTKKRKIHNLAGYFSGVFKNMFNELLQEEVFIHHPPSEPIVFKFF